MIWDTTGLSAPMAMWLLLRPMIQHSSVGHCGGHVNGALHPIASGTGFIDTTFEGYGPNADSELIEQLQDGKPTWRLLSLKDGTLGAPLPESADIAAPLQDLYRNV